MKKPYFSPEIEIVFIGVNGVLDDVIHSTFESGGGNSGWDWNDDDDENFDF